MNTEERVKKFSWESKTKEAKIVEPCKCGHDRWKTIVKDQKWECRKCHTVRGQ